MHIAQSFSFYNHKSESLALSLTSVLHLQTPFVVGHPTKVGSTFTKWYKLQYAVWIMINISPTERILINISIFQWSTYHTAESFFFLSQDCNCILSIGDFYIHILLDFSLCLTSRNMFSDLWNVAPTALIPNWRYANHKRLICIFIFVTSIRWYTF